MARLFLTARNAAVFFVHGPGRRLSTHDFWQLVRTFPVDLQWEVCLELGEERLVLCVVPTATAEVRVSGCLMRPPFEDVMLSLLSLSFPLRQELLQHLELPDLAFLVSTCSELHDVVMNQKSWEIEHTAYLKSLPSQILFAAAPTYRLYPTAYASLHSTQSMAGQACVVMSCDCQLNAIVIGFANMCSSSTCDAEARNTCSCTFEAPFHSECRTRITWSASKQPPAHVSCPFLVSTRSIHVFDICWQRQLLCMRVDGRNVRCVNISCLEMQNDAYVYMYCIGEEVCKATMQMAFADRGDERLHDYAGGSTVMNDQISSVSQMLQGEIIACVAAAHELLHLRVCSKTFLEVLGQDSLLRGSVIDLRNAKPRAFRPGSAFARLIRCLHAHTYSNYSIDKCTPSPLIRFVEFCFIGPGKLFFDGKTISTHGGLCILFVSVQAWTLQFPQRFAFLFLASRAVSETARLSLECGYPFRTLSAPTLCWQLRKTRTRSLNATYLLTEALAGSMLAWNGMHILLQCFWMTSLCAASLSIAVFLVGRIHTWCPGRHRKLPR